MRRTAETSRFWRYAIAAAAVGAAVCLRALLYGIPTDQGTFFFYYPALVVATLYGRIEGGLLALLLSAASALLWQHPSGDLSTVEWPEVVTLLLFCGVGALIVWLCEVANRARARASETVAQQQLADQKVHAALEQGEQRLRSSIESLLDAFAIYSAERDAQGQLVDLKLEYANTTALAPGAEAVVGLLRTDGPSGLPGLPDGLFEACRRVVETGEPFHVEAVRISAPQGQTPPERWLEIRAGRVGDGLAIAWRDVTDRELAAIERARLAAIIDSSNDAIISKTLTGVVQSWNESAHQIFGYTAAEAIGHPLMELIIPYDRTGEEEAILASIRAGRKVNHIDTIRRRKDGKLIHVSISTSPVKDASGRIVGASKIARDITVQRQADEERSRLLRAERAARAEAERANNAKDAFLAVLSHELRTPLNPVLLTVSLLEREMSSLPEHIRRDLRDIRRNVELEARLIDDLLDITRIKRGKLELHPETVDVHALVRTAINICCREAGQTIEIALDAERHFARADPGRLTQVFWNLLNNSMKFTPPDGTIRIQSRNEEGDVVIEVSDTGAGIDPALLPRLFNAFEQGPMAGARGSTGLGLGLAISSALVKAHGGMLTARSAGPGQGSTFTVRVPSAAPAPAASEPAATPAAGQAGEPPPVPVGKPRRVLLVEDNESTLRIMKRVLLNLKYDVTTAATLADAVDHAGRTKFDVVISDLGLPDGMGYDLMRQIRVHQDVAGIAISGYGMEEDLRRSAEAGFAEHLTKPVDLQQLMDALGRVSAAAGAATSTRLAASSETDRA